MTYGELSYRATKLYTKGKITLDKYMEMTKPLDREIEQEPKKGHWIRVTDKAGHLVWECDKCGWQQRYNTNFCPDCGVKMEGEDKE